MSIKAKLVGLEKRMHVTDLGRNCPLCRTRPAEVWLTHDKNQPLPPSQEPPCPLCGKGPERIIVYSPHIASIDGAQKGPTLCVR